MNKDDFLRLIADIQKININNNGSEEELINIISFMKNFEDCYSELIDKLSMSTVRYSDYYSSSLNSQTIIDSFNLCYPGKDKEEQLLQYITYVLFKNLREIVEAFNLFCVDEISDYLQDTINNMLLLIDEFEKINGLNQKEELSFENNKYKIFFTAYSYDDITSHESFVIKSLINKLNNILSKEDTIKGAEIVGHVKDKYNVPIFRIQLADDYRITFLRKDNVTAILGIELKSGKDKNYTRYDNIAKRIDVIYEEIDKFLSGTLPEKSIHNKVMKYITDFEKRKAKKNHEI